ncbi:MAG: TetR/AcrR family transcriptional regulator [Candidatus Limnocylindrales bacterium]
MHAATMRHTAAERREEILEAAFDAFADTGLDNTSVETIARAVGLSQPYLFRLFGTKKHLFLAAVELCFEQTMAVFREAVDGGSPDEAKRRMGDAYVEMIRDRRKLRMQMQAYAACEDPDVRRTVQDGFARLAAYIQQTTGASPTELAEFLAQGMLLNVLASMDVLDSAEPWAVMIREGCMAQRI